MPSKPIFHKALITGTSSGIGKALARFLESQGIEVIRVSRTSGDTRADLTKKEDMQTVLALIAEKNPDLIVNNAGFGLYGPACSHEIQEELNCIEVCVNALVAITLHSAKQWLSQKKKGTILNISSLGAFFSFPTFTTYCASKAFVLQFSRGIDAELRPQGIRVLCACPGQVETGFRNRAAKGKPQQKDHRTMNVETAVELLWEQLQKGTGVKILGAKNQWMLFASKFIPRTLLNRLLVTSVKNRY